MMIVFLLLLSLLKYTESNWVLEVRLYQYSNPTSRRSDRFCCDTDGVLDGICMNPCDNDFLFCLRVDVTSPSCQYGAYQTGLVAGGDELNFTGVASIGENNVSHPLLFNGTQWPENNQVDFLVRVFDLDPDGSNFIGVIGTPLTYTNASGGPSDIITLRGIRISIEASFDLRCDTNYYGSQCDVFCRTHDEELGHYTCDSQGNKICSGRYDIETNCTMFLPCDPVCNSNQQCIPSNNTCACIDGWRGPACNQCTNCTATPVTPLSTTTMATMIPSTTATSGSLPTNSRRTATIIYASIAVGGLLIITTMVVLIIITLFFVHKRNNKEIRINKWRTTKHQLSTLFIQKTRFQKLLDTYKYMKVTQPPGGFQKVQ
ncbi:PREDICTED: delta-like protein A isoform X2 [Amphimedon queenslandica]|uniref:Delta-like protein n=1 Tax=Amphimedon queenslandica TaxID=400682 RepID=A0AAN0IZA5_AMPQE|nr:PREDICTED: delta-like protein A isoform X2 [Amphimedon queenslandica]|eukprot:XP_019850104.1 PREDICTED: delta-like protein A isoform X2 [Amphimedon queenslandica]